MAERRKIFKIVLLGDDTVGKTALRHGYLGGKIFPMENKMKIHYTIKYGLDDKKTGRGKEYTMLGSVVEEL